MANDFTSYVTRMRDRLSTVGKAIADAGAEIAEENLSGFNASVDVEVIDETTSDIVANGEEIAFIEYGTGRPGEMSAYPADRLPKDAITFESAGETHTTQGWEYYYENKKTKRTVEGVEGWFYNGQFETGDEAQMPMLLTSQKLRRELKNIAKAHLTGGE